MKSAVHCLTVPAEAPFLRTLAAWALESHPADLAGTRILLPTKRACRALRETFLDLAGGKPMLLPRIQPIGDMDDNDVAADIIAEIALQDIPAAIAPERRLLLLTGLVMQFERRRNPTGYPMSQAVDLARQLARFLDDIGREGLDIHSLSTLAPEDMAVHWQQTIDFLKIVSQAWPKVLKDEGVIELIDRRNRILRAVASRWQHTPPGYPVIAAGSTGTQPATAALLAVIARLPQGRVVLPGLDQDMPDGEWDMVGPTHPQYALKSLLKHMGCTRDEITNLTLPLKGRGQGGGPLSVLQEDPHLNSPPSRGRKERVDCLRTVFLPPPATANWPQSEAPLADGLRNMQLLVADTLLDEARMAAIALREVLEAPGKTAALVTPDRRLARMVAAQMERFGIAIDDSAGQPLLDTPPGYFLRLIIEMVASCASPVGILAVLRHPLAAAGREPAECRRLSRLLETEYLRGVRLAEGLPALRDAIDSLPRRGRVRVGAGLGDLKSLLAGLEKHTRTLATWFAGKKSVAPSALLKAHLELAEWLAEKDQLWAGDAGNQLAERLARIMEHADVLPPVDPQSYPGFFTTLLAEDIYRPRYGKHPRLHILSPMEARMQRFDKVILSGLNEDVWPAHAAADPWMSRPMREAFGLPPAERSIGQSAHDFFQLCAAPDVLLTRARKVDGSPTVPSRWLVRLETLLNGHDVRLAESHYEQAKAILDAPVAMKALSQPRPAPPMDARPRRMRVTAIDKWIADPYMIYAQYVLGLKALPPLDEEPGKADFGELVHHAIKCFCDRWPGSLPDNAYEELLKAGRETFRAFSNRPAVACLWWPRFEAMAAWLAAQEKTRRAQHRILAEREGSLLLTINGTPFTLTTRIDRLEIDNNNRATLVDYKTGALPSDSNQLPLEGLVVMQGILNPALAHALTVTGLEYWKLAGREENCEIKALGEPEEISAMLAECKKRLEALLTEYNNPATPFAAQTNPALLPSYNDYEHLTRRQEWQEA